MLALVIRIAPICNRLQILLCVLLSVKLRASLLLIWVIKLLLLLVLADPRCCIDQLIVKVLVAVSVRAVGGFENVCTCHLTEGKLITSSTVHDVSFCVNLLGLIIVIIDYLIDV